ncbi:MAG: periplasmic heavy metal sensor [Aureispira sp.]|nr:periplasmic heavy metal sensor [Aureispira sp.]
MKIWSKVASSLLILSCLLISYNSFAQPPRGHHHKGGHHGNPMDPKGEHFYPPEMIMHHKSDIKLTKEQQEYIIKVTQETQSTFTAKKWAMHDAKEAMKKLLEAEKVDEAKTYAQLDKILALEGEMKKQKLGLMIKIKNKLTADQKKKLDELKKKHRAEKGAPRPPRPPHDKPRPPQPPKGK